ncbi:MAG TPA: PD-(D/E)XK nuclease family protein [Acidimicrobiales bacterium]|nr:PD-(D/E)XK nuclease family protein [Acidimicrobiales bacterium]
MDAGPLRGHTTAVDEPAAGLTPAQRRVVVELMAQGRQRPRFAADVAEGLRRQLEDSLGPLLGADLPSAEALWLTKSALGQVHACEAHHLAERGESFQWNARTARGTVAHRALELSVSTRGRLPPLDLVDRAIASLGADHPRGTLRPWLSGASDLDVADLRSGANEVVTKFLECWPPLKPAWSPRTETAIGAPLCGDQVMLWGKVDLVLGQARGDEARALVVDLKTGRPYPSHLDDLRFYALVQALRVGVPPFRVASYYLDTASFHVEDVTVDTLALAVRRTVDGVRKLVELRAGRAPAITPGPACSWCRLAQSCDGARRWREADVDDEGG